MAFPSRSCPKCHSKPLMISTAKSFGEEFLDVLGIPHLRCHHCAARYAKIGNRLLSADKKKRESPFWFKVAIGTGLLALTVIALAMQWYARRWPF